jgi:hypothetical protein
MHCSRRPSCWQDTAHGHCCFQTWRKLHQHQYHCNIPLHFLAQACNPTAISLKAGCELFLRYATRTSALEDQNFASAKERIIQVISVQLYVNFQQSHERCAVETVASVPLY